MGFSYDSQDTVLRDVTFTAKQGEVTALIGPSGGGKTTVSRLASRFWDINKGKITVGGMDISTIDPETLMSLYAIVFQDVTLFNNTVMETSVSASRMRRMKKCWLRQNWRTVMSSRRSFRTLADHDR